MKRVGNLLNSQLLILFNCLFFMSYSFFIWGSEPRADGTFYPWEIINVIPDCPVHFARLLLKYATNDNPGYLVAMTTEPKVPNILSGQCSSLF